MRLFASLVLPLLLLPAAMARAARERTGNVDVFVVLDESGSMKPIFPKVTTYIAEALVQDYLEPRDYICVVGFSNLPRVRVSQQLSSGAEKENLVELVRNLNVVPQGYTDMGRALEETLRQLERLADPSHQQIILILTDGLNQPPRESPYFDPVRKDAGAGTAPPSGFNPRFLAQVQRLASHGWRIHVVGIGSDTDARKLAEALGSGHTILKEFSIDELKAGLAEFWDDTINLVGLELPRHVYRPGETVTAMVRIRSTSDKQREVRLRGARVAALAPLAAVPGTPLDATALRVSIPLAQWPAPPHKEVAYDITIALPLGFPAGDYRALLSFDQESAVKFYPQQAEIAFHIPSFWELHGRKVIAGSVGVALAIAGVVIYRRRPIPLVLVVEGEAPGDAAKAVPFRISTACSVGGGATDRFRVPGLPQKVAVLERRSVDRFALLSSNPELVPTLLEYSLGDPVEVRTGGTPSDRRIVRFVRFTRKARRPRAHPPVRPAAPPPAQQAGGGVDFR